MVRFQKFTLKENPSDWALYKVENNVYTLVTAYTEGWLKYFTIADDTVTANDNVYLLSELEITEPSAKELDLLALEAL